MMRGVSQVTTTRGAVTPIFKGRGLLVGDKNRSRYRKKHAGSRLTGCQFTPKPTKNVSTFFRERHKFTACSHRCDNGICVVPDVFGRRLTQPNKNVNGGKHGN